MAFMSNLKGTYYMEQTMALTAQIQNEVVTSKMGYKLREIQRDDRYIKLGFGLNSVRDNTNVMSNLM